MLQEIAYGVLKLHDNCLATGAPPQTSLANLKRSQTLYLHGGKGAGCPASKLNLRSRSFWPRTPAFRASHSALCVWTASFWTV